MSRHRHAHGMVLVVSRHLLDQRTAAVVLEDDEVVQQRKEAARLEDAFQHHLEFGHVRVGQRLSGDGAPGLEPLPARGQCANAGLVPVRTTSASFMENSAGISAL